MRRTHIPAQSGEVKERVKKLRNDCDTALSKFCRDKIVEHKLAPKTLSFNFDFRGASTDIRRSLVRLKTLFGRALEKKLPYVEYTEEPFFKILSREKFVITLTSFPETGQLLTPEFNRLNSTRRQILAESTNFAKLIRRYVRYLQFLCLKYSLPFEIGVRFTARTSFESQRIYETLCAEQRMAYHPEIQYAAEIRISLVYWVYGPYTDRENGASISMDNFIQQQLEELSSAEMYDHMQWNSNEITYGFHQVGGIVGRTHLLSRYWAIEKIFFYIPQILKVLQTLTRVTTYVPTAFSIGASENS
jgi:hypothetical protein